MINSEGHTKDKALTGKPLHLPTGAEEAVQAGLVSRLLPEDQLEGEVGTDQTKVTINIQWSGGQDLCSHL